MRQRLKPLTWVLASAISFAGFPQIVHAELIGTAQLAAAPQSALPGADAARALLDSTLARADIADGLRRHGVDPAEALARVQALSDREAMQLAQQIESAPAGASDIVGTIVFIFVLLLITDILGFTKVYPFTRSIR